VPSTTQTARADIAPFGTLNAALSTFALGMRRNFANWPILMGRALFYLVAITVLTSLWDRVAAQHVAGALTLPPGGITLYFGTTEWITLSIAAIHLRLEDDIRFGALEPHLLRPKPYLLQRIAEALGDSFGRLIGIGIAALAALLLSGRALPPPAAFACVAVLGVFGTAIGVLLMAIVGLCAFWVRRVLPPYLIMQKSLFLLGGLFAPISLYPGWFFHAAVMTPFAANLFLVGNQMTAPSIAGFVQALGAQIAWLAVLSVLTALLWRAGLRKILREGV
jgi:ABC-type uncharacterized transport system permease subunit